MFGGSLFSRWVTARQAASADPADIVARLLTWMANDQYGFWSHVEDDIASALDEAGRAACAGHLERLLGDGTHSAFIRRQLDKLLRAVYIAQRDADAYTALAERSGLTTGDCLALATTLAAKDDPTAALAWVERGLRIESSYDLRAKQRELLTALGRRDEAIQREWSHFTGERHLFEVCTIPWAGSGRFKGRCNGGHVDRWGITVSSPWHHRHAYIRQCAIICGSRPR